MKFFEPSGVFFLLKMFGKNRQKVVEWLQSLSKIILFNDHRANTFVGDELITFGKSLDFLREDKFVDLATKNFVGPGQHEPEHRALIWRRYIQIWAGEHCKKLNGSFCDFGCYDGAASNFVNDYCDLESSNIKFYLYDLFETPPNVPKQSKHDKELYDEVKNRFKNYKNIEIIRGSLPETLEENCPENISFAHIDLNNAETELSVLEFIYDRIAKGGIILFDDYGWSHYKDQQVKEKEFLEKRGQKTLELPTGQGLLIKW